MNIFEESKFLRSLLDNYNNQKTYNGLFHNLRHEFRNAVRSKDMQKFQELQLISSTDEGAAILGDDAVRLIKDMLDSAHDQDLTEQ